MLDLNINEIIASRCNQNAKLLMLQLVLQLVALKMVNVR